MFAKALEAGLPNLHVLRLVFNNVNPDPPIESWGIFSEQLYKGLPNLYELYIINEIDCTTEKIPEIILAERQYSRSYCDYHNEWDSLNVLHVPWQIANGMRLPESLRRNLIEFLVDVKDYVEGR